MTKTTTRILAGLVLLMAVPLGGCQTTGMTGEQALVVDASSNDLVMGQEQFRAGNFGLAEDAFKRVVEKDPANADGWLGLGATHDQLRRFDLADRDYAQVEKLTGRTAALLNNRGYSHLLRGNFAGARKDFNEALRLSPGNADLEANLAAALRGRKP